MNRMVATVLVSVVTAGCSTASYHQPPIADALAAGWEGKQVCELLSDQPAYRILRCTFPPGAGHERHYHPPHFGYALSGGRAQLTDASGTREVTLADNSSFESKGVTWHEMRNVGETEIVYLMVEDKRGAMPAD